MNAEGTEARPYVPERRVILVPRHVDGEARFPLSFPTMAKAAAYLDVPPHDVRAAFVRGCMVASRRDGRSWFVDATEEVPEEDGGDS